MRWLIVVVAGILLSSNTDSRAQAIPEGAGRIEGIMGLTLDAEGVTFQVRSRGCTRPENFRIERFGSAPTQLLLIRTVDDRCDALIPYGTTFKISHTQLRLASREAFVVINPIASAEVVNLF